MGSTPTSISSKTLAVCSIYEKFEAKASPFRAGMKPTNSIQPPTMAQTGFQRNL